MTVEASVRIGLLAPLCALWIAGLICAQSAASDPAFPLDEDPQGLVTDMAGRPIAGAKVEVLCYRDRAGYLRALEEGMLRLPLLPAISGRDGSFVLPLTELHRLFYGAGPGRFILQVSREGYLPWREPLARGLSGYLGGRIKLKKLAEVSRIQIEVEDPQPGMLFALEEWNQTVRGNRSRSWTYLPVPADGRLLIEGSLMPWPALSTQGGDLEAKARFGQLLYPGRSLPETDLLSVGETLRVTAGESAGQPALNIEFDGEEEPEQVWGIYRLPSGKLLRFTFDAPRLPRDPILRLVWVGADGYAMGATQERESIRLKRLPDPQDPLIIRVVDEQDRGIRGARFCLKPFLQPDWEGGSPPQRPLADLSTAADGRVRIPRQALGDVSRLRISAPGFHGMDIIDPRVFEGEREFVLRRLEGAKVDFRMVDEQGRRLPGAVLFLSDRVYDLRDSGGAAVPPGPLRSDDHGKVSITGLSRGVYRYRCVAANRAPTQGRFEISDKLEDQVIEIELLDAQSLRLRCMDPDSEPLAFACLNLSLRDSEGTRSLPPVWTDSLGRLWLRGIPEGTQVVLSSRRLFRTAVEERFFPDDSRVESMVFEPTQPVFVRVPSGSRKLRTTLINGLDRVMGGSSTSVTGPPAKLPSTAFFGFAWDPREDSQVLIGVGDGPVVRVRSDDADIHSDEAGGPRLVDRRKIVRRVALRFPELTREQLSGLRIQPQSPHYGGKMVSNRAGNMLEVDAEGVAWFLARDRGEYLCRVLHPEFLLTELRVPAADPGAAQDEEAIEVRLTAGTGVSFQKRLEAEDLAGRDMNLSIRSDPGGIVLFAQDFWQPPADALPGDLLRIPCPTALVPGEYVLDLNIGEKLNRKIMLLPDKPMTIELGKD